MTRGASEENSDEEETSDMHLPFLMGGRAKIIIPETKAVDGENA